MDDKRKLLMLLGIIDGISKYEYIGQEVSFDPDINDCLIYMYIYMMSSDDKYYEEFDNRYSKLNEEQQEFVKNNYINIINAQDEFENEKIKRKGEMNYE